MTLLTIEDLSVSYGDKPAVQGISLHVEPGEMTAIVGESGSGKTTTAMSALGLNSANARIDSGRITFDGQDVTHFTHKQWRALRGARVGLIPQDPNNSLNPLKTIGHSIEEGLRIHGRTQNLRATALDWLARVGIDDPERRYRQYPHELSGGMKQRVLIAAALALEPDLIVADEPTSALDVTVQKTILDLLDDMRRELGLGILFITHDLSVAGDRANRIVVMEKGEVREEGLAARVFADPQHPYSRRLLADAPSLTVADVDRHPESFTSPRKMAASETLVQVRDLTRTFGDFTAVDHVSFDVARGTTHAIVGESGSGKTTTGRIISMFEQASSGTVTVGGHDVTAKHSKAELKELRRGIQLVYQNPYSSLNPRMSIGDIIAEPLRNFTGTSKSAARTKAREFLDLVALDPQFAERRPRELSGGQRQRVAIARAMIVEPELVILDEAVSALDVTVQAQILRLLDRLQRELDLTYIFISHDLAVVSQISDTVSVLRHGKQLESGTTREVFAHPASPFTRELIDAIPGQRYRAGDLNLGL
ncbi:ABC transporter ATP-binding protein [Corynebacterium phoceense]|uniref:dipeptide ABC transporter ATP-binding protein n=1 Tax=Corynebacterium phoceense TaxID=1686286 RepID=UPI00211C2917|nr:ABC transporter ATP-binding protein [Corynebacterium phoceense]MCQ9331883.1 ABC transporter ATP-binding protein [Corynebacterium phoceense]MCQ9348062.1 ABC transporter ATP-binding protein [Corynebacterium phoceense]